MQHTVHLVFETDFETGLETDRFRLRGMTRLVGLNLVGLLRCLKLVMVVSGICSLALAATGLQHCHLEFCG